VYRCAEVGRICTSNVLPPSLLQHTTPPAPTAKPYPWCASTVTACSVVLVQLGRRVHESPASEVRSSPPPSPAAHPCAGCVSRTHTHT
jgi:hypothetical protein